MATQTAELILHPAAPEQTCQFTVCHFTTAHTQLKSLSFHRELMPLAASGIGVQYVSPMQDTSFRDGIQFVSLRQRTTRLSRIFAQSALLRTLLRQNASVYHFQDPQLLPLAFTLKLIFRKRVVYDAYEDFPSMAANKRAIPRILRSIAAKIVNYIERAAARCFDGVMTADPFTLRRLARCGKNRKLVFYNFPNLDFFPKPRPRAKQFDVVYRGGLSERAGTWVLLEAMRILAARPEPVRLLLIGYFDDLGAEKALCDRISALSLASSVEIRGRLDHEEMADSLVRARIGVCPLQAVPKFLLNIPVKVFEYWACGLPVVASDLPPIRPFFRNSAAGILHNPESSTALAQSIAWLLDNADAAERMGERGRELVAKRFNNGGEVHKLRAFFARIAATEKVQPSRQGAHSPCSNLS